MNRLRWRLFALAMMIGGFFLITACKSSSEVKIGVIVPREGSSLAHYGFQLESGITLASQEINELHNKQELKKKYTLIFENESDDVAKVKETFNKLVGQGVSAIIGPASSAAMLELEPLANEARVVLLSPASSSPEINLGNADFVF